MIQGLQIEISSAELGEHLRQRAEYHKERAGWYGGQVDGLRSGGLRPEGVTNDPISSLERSMKEHKERAAFFLFMAEHLIPGETYRMTEVDFGRLELIARYIL